ncbi:MAG: esterase [Alphaproteobacteria bacterium]|nr:esterase [Alphaproteobacteria bacterium]
MHGRIMSERVESSNVPGEVAASIYLPEGYGELPQELYPLLLLLHGGDGSEQDLLRFAPVIDAAIAEGRIPPLVVVMPGARRSLYMDYRDGSEKWESFIVSDLLPQMRSRMRISGQRRHTCIGGYSMGGLGSLRLAFKHPDIFGTVASLEPAIEPALCWQEVGPRVLFWRPQAFMEGIFGSPIDADYWAANNPATIARRDPSRLLDLGIYLEVGDQDMLYLHEGTELLHRILFDAGISHEYRLVRGAEHVGPSLNARIADALGFMGRQLAAPNWIDEKVLEVRAIMDAKKRAVGMPLDGADPRRIRGS